MASSRTAHVATSVRARAGRSRVWKERAAPLLRRIARAPLTHFALVGLLLFVLAEYHRGATDPRRIVVTPAQVATLTSAYSAQFGVPPSPQVRARLIASYVDQEILYREALARGLERDDEIVRRRLIQKMEFLIQDLGAVAEPTDRELASFYKREIARYAKPATVAFSHIFFADGAGGPDLSRRRAQAVLARLSPVTERAPDRGDPFPDLYDYAAFGGSDARRLFGDTEISRRLFDVPSGVWAGPFRSAYGWHLVRVRSHEAAEPAPFDAVRDTVRADLLAARQARANDSRFAGLKARFDVILPEASAP